MEIFGYKFNIVNKDADMPEEADTMGKIPYPKTLQRTRQDLSTWRNATILAENLQNPNRTNLLRLYKDVDLDAHLSSLVQTRKNAILGAKFIVVDKKGEENEELTERITKKWFYDFVSLSLDSIYWGYSLIEFGDLLHDEFVDVDLVERRYVHPEFGTVSQTLHDSTAICYLESPYKEWNIGVGGKRDLGLYLKAAPLILWKKQAFAQWSEFTETAGVPLKIGKTNVRDETTRSNMFNTLKDMGSSFYSVIDKNDEIEILQGNTASGYQEIFNELINQCNRELSKLILGQTMTTDDGSSQSQAEVHERIMQMVVDRDTIFIQNVFTYQLVPFLNEHQLGFEGHSIVTVPDDELDLKEKSEIDLKLLEYYDIPAEYIAETYGTPVEDKVDINSPEQVKNRLDELFKT